LRGLLLREGRGDGKRKGDGKGDAGKEGMGRKGEIYVEFPNLFDPNLTNNRNHLMTALHT